MAGGVARSTRLLASMRRLDMLCGTQAHVIDQSDGRVLLRLSGPSARQILAKGIGVDLHPAAFALGGSTNVLCGHIAINLSRTARYLRADRFAQLCRIAVRGPDDNGASVRSFRLLFPNEIKCGIECRIWVADPPADGGNGQAFFAATSLSQPSF